MKRPAPTGVIEKVNELMKAGPGLLVPVFGGFCSFRSFMCIPLWVLIRRNVFEIDTFSLDFCLQASLKARPRKERGLVIGAYV